MATSRVVVVVRHSLIVGALRSFAAKSRAPPFLRIVIAPSFQLQSKNDLQVSKDLVEIYKKLEGHFVI